MALAALEVGPGDEVVVPSMTFVATANAVRYCGATPVFADIESLDEWNVSAASIERVMTPRTGDHRRPLRGLPCDMREIMALSERTGVPVVEDVAHAPGASLDGKPLGAWGDLGCFSFFSNKNMTTAEGGMVTTRRPGTGRSSAMAALAWHDDADARPPQGSCVRLRRCGAGLQLSHE